ncbi:MULTISPECIES: spermidine/putrescine ABC transporter substrate-binding protein [unclassified Leptolyngbya]|uniref:polyamine ABC transporter substrate-binding protein n=1 Tax=unclassified Leptolyngbya TaxID=2650499 RepID=UPI0016874813|nr:MULTISPECIES: spermidine/putrescine ABC transporter substrate-binding protein [unclassified Leptolyngbya]MBD1912244.1 spermidine/putrescine ABC transporter substrate-binding protein [Leptolyngbya sp. FACHB-8]MBD2155135.1 spermidine/putrescine ABC transporter substrate-binding protein [Leptolyngbya sp. FACHB-16]
MRPQKFSSSRRSRSVSRGKSPLILPSRRRFLQYSLAAFSGVALANCQRSTSNTSANPSASSNSGANPAANGEPLYIYTWADYLSEEVNQRFTEATGIEVVADVYDSNEVMLAKLQAGGGNQYSIIYPSDYMVRQMIELNLLTSIDKSRLTGLENLVERWQNPTYDADNAHSIPVSWGTTGFIYNNKVINPGPEDWDFLWENKDSLSRKITLLDDVREVMGAALKSLGYSYNSTNEQELKAAYEKLRELKPSVASFESFGWEDRLISGDLNLCMSYSILGNALTPENPQLTYVIPSSGTSVWTDTLAIPKTAPNVDAAYAWMNFLLEPENSAFAVSKLRFATPNKLAFEQLPSELKENEKLFPPETMLAKCEGIKSVGDTIKIYDGLWTQLRSV